MDQFYFKNKTGRAFSFKIGIVFCGDFGVRPRISVLTEEAKIGVGDVLAASWPPFEVIREAKTIPRGSRALPALKFCVAFGATRPQPRDPDTAVGKGACAP